MNKTNNKEKRVAPVYWRRLFRQFKIFYHSKYGRVGFYILLAFAITSLVTPFVVAHPNYAYELPEVDTHVSSEIVQTYMGNLTRNGATLYSPMDTMVDGTGEAAIYFGSSNGILYYYGLGVNKETPAGIYRELYNSHVKFGVKMNQPLMFPLMNCKEYSLGVSASLMSRFVVMPYTNNNITLGTISFYDSGLIVPNFTKLGNIQYNGTILTPVISNAGVFEKEIGTDIPTFNYEGLGLANPGMLYFVVNTTSGNYLDYYQISPLLYSGHIKLNMSNPQGILFYGNHFSYRTYQSDARILVYNMTTVKAYFASNDTLSWISHLPAGFNTNIGLIIPSHYQISPSNINSAYFVFGTQNYERINLENGSLSGIVNVGDRITALSITPGSSGLPSFIIASSPTSQYVFGYNSKGNETRTVVSNPTGSGLFIQSATYDSESSSLILISEKGSLISFNLVFGGKFPFQWSAGLNPAPTNTSKVLTFVDLHTGIGAIAVIGNNHYMYLYNSTAKQCTPIPPMANTPSGNTYPLGSTQYGNDVWARFMESFYTDWIFGITIGIFTLAISLAVSLYVGYKGRIGGTILETLSLGLYLVPGLALLIALSSVLPGDSNFIDIILIVSAIGWPYAAFTLIGVVKGVKARTFVEASRLFGAKSGSIMRKHILPNIGPLLIYLLALSIGAGIGSVSGLQFLGLVPVDVATWGGMLNAAFTNFFVVVNSPQWILPPAVALSMFIFALIFVSRGMDEVSNPRLRRR